MELLFHDTFAMTIPFAGRARTAEGKIVTFDPRAWLKDHAGTPDNGAEFDIEATASGVLINNRVYPGVKVKKSIPSFTHPFEKPVLLHHRDDKDPIGRIKSARFEQYVTGAAFEDDWKSPEILDQIKPNPTPGSGRVIIRARITDPEALEKIEDERFRTGSVSFRSDAAVCSICGQNWVTNGWCEHIPGRTYMVEDEHKKKKLKALKAFQVMGLLQYNEWSFVNIPAYPNSGIITNCTEDQKHLDSCNLSACTSMPAVVRGLRFMDQQGALVVIDEGKAITEEKIVIKAQDDCPECEYSDEEFAEVNILAGLHDQKLLDFSPSRIDGLDENSIMNKIIRFSDAKLTPTQRRELPAGMFCGPNRSFPVPDCAHVFAARRLLPRFKGPGNRGTILACINRRARVLKCSPSRGDTVDFSQEFLDGFHFASLADAGVEIDYALLEKDTGMDKIRVDRLIKDLSGVKLSDEQCKALGFTDEDLKHDALKDRVLTPEARKRLPAAIFCGPDRSFPVPDCRHAANAKARLVHSKVGNKSAVLACINRRAKALKCPFATKKPGGDSDQFASNAPEIQDPQVAALTAALATAQDKIDDLAARIEFLDREMELRQSEYEQLEDQAVTQGESYLNFLVNGIVALRQALQKPDLLDKSAEALGEYRKDLAKRQPASLADAWQDLLKEWEAAGAKPKLPVTPGTVKSSVTVPNPVRKPTTVDDRLAEQLR